MLVGCGSSPVPSPSSSNRPFASAFNTSLPVGTVPVVATIAPTPTAAAATDVPIGPPQTDATALPAMRQVIDVDKVAGVGAAGCAGQFLESVRSSAFSHDAWTIRCDQEADADKMLDNVKTQLEKAGALVSDLTTNTAPSGDASYEINYTDDGLVGNARLVVLNAGRGQIVVFTIDQTPS
jgi:hypothetical protein